MALSSRRSAKRLTTTAVVGLLTAAILASCGHITAGAPVGSTTTSQPASEVRLGCGTYCQSAGGLQGTLAPGKDAVTVVSSGTVSVDSGGYLPVTVTCNLSVQCRGSIVIQANWGPTDPSTGEPLLGRSDLLVDASATAVLGVKLPAELLAVLPAHQPPCPMWTPPLGGAPRPACPNVVDAIVDAGPSFGCDGKAEGPTGGPVLGLPFCAGGPINGFAYVSLGTIDVVAAG
jgi:hypothetical protein